MAEHIIAMKWQRPDSVEYPKVWHRFEARDLNSDKLVEYRIEDLPATRAEDVFKHLKENYMAGEPISQALGGGNDPEFFEDYLYGWKSILAQKTPLVCYRDGSDEIVGVNWTFITHKDDHFVEQYRDNCKSPVSNTLFGIFFMLYENFDPFKHYGVDEYLSSFGLSVDRKFRGRSIGDQFMIARKNLCKEFGFKMTHTMFSSDYSSRNAENAGFKTDVSIRFDEIMKVHPEFNLSNIKSTGMSVKTLVY